VYCDGDGRLPFVDVSVPLFAIFCFTLIVLPWINAVLSFVVDVTVLLLLLLLLLF
jgi:hypothetical protein